MTSAVTVSTMLDQLRAAAQAQYIKKLEVKTWSYPTQFEQVWYVQFHEPADRTKMRRLIQYFKDNKILADYLGDDLVRVYIKKI